MKFTKHQAVEALSAMVPDKDKELDLGRTISEVVENCMELVGEGSEMGLEEFVGNVWKSVRSSIGLAHNENSKVAQRVRSQMSREQQQQQEEAVASPSTDEVSALAAELAELRRRLDERDAEALVAEKRRLLAAKMGESIKDASWIDAYLREIPVTADTDVDAKAKDYVAFYNKTSARGGSVTPLRHSDTDGGASKVREAVAAAAAMRARMSGGRAAAEDGAKKK